MKDFEEFFGWLVVFFDFLKITFVIKEKCYCIDLLSVSFCFIGLVTAEKWWVFLHY
jgi:hypothetical protein